MLKPCIIYLLTIDLSAYYFSIPLKCGCQIRSTRRSFVIKGSLVHPWASRNFSVINDPTGPLFIVGDLETVWVRLSVGLELGWSFAE